MQGFQMSIKTDSGLELVLRPYREGELEKYVVPGLQSFEVARYLTLTGSQTLEMEQQWLDKVSKDPNYHGWAICVRTDDGEVPVGHTSFQVKGNIGSSGIVIYNRDWWGKGVASASHLARTRYAFKVMDLIAIRSGVAQPNVGSRKALESVGYRCFGTEYHIFVVDGQVCHVDGLLLVNPTDRCWNFFWGDTKPPKKFRQARKLTREALKLAERIVTFD